MSSTTFINYKTPISAEWLNDVNTAVYGSSGTLYNVVYSGYLQGGSIQNTPISGSTGSFTTLQAASINSTPIGATTPSTGAFTTLSAVNTIQTGTNAINGVNIVNGPSSGTAGGSAVIVQNIGTPIIAIGNKSALVGGAYDATPYIYSLGTINTNAGLSVTGALSATGGSITSGNGTISNVLSYGTGGIVGTTSNHSLSFITNNSTQATLDTSGNLGLGVTPSAWGNTYKSLEGTFGQGWYYNNAATLTGVTSNTYNNGTSWIYKTTNPAMRYELGGAGTHTWFTAPSGTAGNPITFTQAMTLDNSGNLLVGFSTVTDTPTQGLSLNTGGTGVGRLAVGHPTGTASGNLYAQFSYNGTAIGSITQSGTTAVVYSTTSDHRLKTNVRDANAARFMDIKFRDFEWVDGRHDCGVIAHELQAVYPDLVTGEKDAIEVRDVEITPAVPAVVDADGNEVTPAIPAVTEKQTFPVYQQVNYTGLIGRMGTTIQKQQRMIEALEARLAALEAK